MPVLIAQFLDLSKKRRKKIIHPAFNQLSVPRESHITHSWSIPCLIRADLARLSRPTQRLFGVVRQSSSKKKKRKKKKTANNRRVRGVSFLSLIQAGETQKKHKYYSHSFDKRFSIWKPLASWNNVEETNWEKSFFPFFPQNQLVFKPKRKNNHVYIKYCTFLIDIFPIISVRRSGSLLLFTVWFALNKRRCCCCCCWSTFPSESLRGGRSWKWNLVPVKLNIAIRMSEQMCAMKIAVLRRLLFIMFFGVIFFPFSWAAQEYNSEDGQRIKMEFWRLIKREAAK